MKVTRLCWLPESNSEFLATFSNGLLVRMDVEKDDIASGFRSDVLENVNKMETPLSSTPYFHDFDTGSAKKNPMSCWLLTPPRRERKESMSSSVAELPTAIMWANSSITDFEISPMGKMMAVVTSSGSLYLFGIREIAKPIVVDIFHSYFGGFLCVTWTPDGRYVATGGQDDLITIYSVQERRVIVRCEGHSSWVNKVAFDPFWKFKMPEEEGGKPSKLTRRSTLTRRPLERYRFASVGSDCRVCIWDLEIQPSASESVKNARRASSAVSRLLSPRTSPMSARASAGISSGRKENLLGVCEVHQAESKLKIPILEPVAVCYEVVRRVLLITCVYSPRRSISCPLPTCTSPTIVWSPCPWAVKFACGSGPPEVRDHNNRDDNDDNDDGEDLLWEGCSRG